MNVTDARRQSQLSAAKTWREDTGQRWRGQFKESSCEGEEREESGWRRAWKDGLSL